MFTTWANTHDFRDYLVPADEYKPFPKWENRAGWEALDGAVRAELVTKAEAYLGFDWPSLPATAFLEYYRSGARVPYEIPHFTRRRALIVLVLGECAEGKGRFIDDIVNGLWAICEESFWGVSAHNGATHPTPLRHYRQTPPLPNADDPYIDLFAGETASLLAWSSYLVGVKLDEVTPQIRRRVSLELERRIMHPFMTRWDFWWMGFTAKKTNNWNPWILSNMMGVFLLEEKNENRRVEAFVKIFDCLQNFLNLYGPDGGCDEGTSYWNKAGGMLCDDLEMLLSATNGRLDFFGEELVRQIGRFMYREHISGSYFINFADGAAKAKLSPEVIYRYAKHIGDEKLTALGAKAPASGVQKHNKAVNDNMWRSLAELFLSDGYAEMAADPSVSYPYIRETWLENIEVMAARETEGSVKGLYLAAKGGHNDESHNHNDVGSVIVYVDGKPALIDVGVGVYRRQTFSEERYTIWTMQSGYHNLPTLNGVTQSPGESYRAENAVCSLTDEAASLALDIAKAYPGKAGVERYRRESRLTRGGAASVTITDEFAFTAEKNTLVLSLMCANKPVVEGSAFTVKIDGESAFRVEFDPAFTAAAETVPTNDDRLFEVWGDAVYRVVLTAEVGKTGKASLVVKKL